MIIPNRKDEALNSKIFVLFFPSLNPLNFLFSQFFFIPAQKIPFFAALKLFSELYFQFVQLELLIATEVSNNGTKNGIFMNVYKCLSIATAARGWKGKKKSW